MNFGFRPPYQNDPHQYPNGPTRKSRTFFISFCNCHISNIIFFARFYFVYKTNVESNTLLYPKIWITLTIVNSVDSVSQRNQKNLIRNKTFNFRLFLPKYEPTLK